MDFTRWEKLNAPNVVVCGCDEGHVCTICRAKHLLDDPSWHVTVMGRAHPETAREVRALLRDLIEMAGG